MAYVLIVDQSPAVRESLVKVLGRGDLEVAGVAPSAMAASLAARRPDLLLLHCARAVDCLPLLREVRAVPGRDGLPVIVYARRLDPAVRRKALAFGAVEYIVKGRSDWDTLLTRVEEHLPRAGPVRGRTATGVPADGQATVDE